MFQVLAERTGVGKVVVCGNCKEVHLGVGAVTINLTTEVFRGLADLLDEANRHPYMRTEDGTSKPLTNLASLFSQA